MRQIVRIEAIFFTAAALVAICTVAIFIFTATGLALFTQQGYSIVDFFTGRSWDAHAELFGLIPLLYGTLLTATLTLLISAPIAILVSLFIVEVAPEGIQRPMRAVIDVMAALPSVVYGLLALTLVIPWVRETFDAALGKGILPAVIVLIFMVQPTIVAVAEDALRSVPGQMKQAAYGIGATRWQTISGVMLPAARSGLITAIILGLGRAVGETMAVQMVIGNISVQVPASLVEAATTMPATIVTEWQEATSVIHQDALIMVGFVLLVITMLLIVSARILSTKTAKV
jgi:phosphate transport system permease protein